MTRKHLVLVFFVWVLAATSKAESLSDWRYIQEVNLQVQGVVKAALPLDTLDHLSAGLGDLRLTDESGSEVPFAIEQPRLPTASWHNVAIEQTSSRQGTSEIKGTLADVEHYDALRINSPASEFVKAVSLEVSVDGARWSVLADHVLLFKHHSGAERLELSFQPQKFSYFRLTVEDRAEAPVPVSDVLVHMVSPASEEALSLPAELISREEVKTTTKLRLRTGARNVWISELNVLTSAELFERQVTLSRDEEDARTGARIASEVLYRGIGADPSAKKLALQVEQHVESQHVVVSIENGDSPPLPIEALRFTYRPIYLVWYSNGGRYRLYLGNARAVVPRYDLTRLVQGAALPPVAPLWSPVTPNPGWREPEVLPEVVTEGAKIDLSAWRYHRRVQIGASGVQALELDPEVLVHAASTLADLRLVQGGKQVPYTQGVTVERVVVPQVTAVDSSSRPSVSRYRLRLPYRGLAVKELRCHITGNYFDRSVRVFSEASGRRGEDVELGRANWRRRLGDDASRAFEVPLMARRLTHDVIVEIENGDNPPLEVKDFTYSYSAPSLVFKVSSLDLLELWYGNQAAGTPRYDLAMLSSELASATRLQASLAPVDGAIGTQPSQWESITGGAGVFFWGVLVLVVAVLLALVRRLLPGRT